MGYNAHSPLASSTPPAILSTVSRPPSASTSNSRSTSAFYQPPSAFSQSHRAPHLPPVAESPLAQFSRPAPLLTTRMPATSSFSQPAISSLSPPASSWPSLPHYAPIATPYSRNPRFSATQVSPGFGVPHAGIPMSTTAGRSRVRSNRKTTMPYGVSKPVKQVSEKQVDIVIFPNDVSLLGSDSLCTLTFILRFIMHLQLLTVLMTSLRILTFIFPTTFMLGSNLPLI
jgi:hypothetical protein